MTEPNGNPSGPWSPRDQPGPGQPGPGQPGPQNPYGYQVPFGQTQYTGAAGGPPVSNTNALAAAICGGVGLLLLFIGLGCWPIGLIGLVSNIAALAVGIVELRSINSGASDESNRGLAMAGVVMGAIGLTLFVVVVLIIFLIIGAIFAGR